jgi:hypothetical protein
VTDPDAVLTLCPCRDELPLAADAYLDAGRATEAALLLELWGEDREPKRMTGRWVREEIRGLWRWFPGTSEILCHTLWYRHWLPLDVIARMPRTQRWEEARNYSRYGAAWLAYLKAEAGTRQEVEV